MKNIVLKAVTWVMGFVALMGMCMMDSEDLRVPIAMVVVGLVWCFVFYRVNEDYIERRL